VLVCVPVFWGYNWVVMKKALDYTGPFQFAAWRFLLGSAILFTAMAGIGLIVFASAASQRGDAAVLALLAGLTWTVGTVVARELLTRQKCDTLALTTWQMLVGGLVLEAAALIAPGRPTVWTPSFLLLLAYEVLPATALAWLLWVSLLGKVEASVASLAGPVIGLTTSMLELGERPARAEAVGMGLMVLGLVLVGPIALRQIGGKRKAARARWPARVPHPTAFTSQCPRRAARRSGIAPPPRGGGPPTMRSASPSDGGGVPVRLRRHPGRGRRRVLVHLSLDS
jgi:drug/metabolite transporter (DMT)-like permease